MTHLDDETLSALIDSELGSGASAKARAHLAGCRDCALKFDRFQAASAAFRKHGGKDVPLEVIARAKIAAAPARKVELRRFAFAAIVSVAIVLMAGVAAKKFMPTLFNNIQQMITGAASQMGSGGK